MGRWEDWDAILAAQERADAEALARKARKRELRVIRPDETPPEPIAAPEAVLEAHEESSPPKPDVRDTSWTRRRPFLEGVRLLLKTAAVTAEQRMRELEREQELEPWER